MTELAYLASIDEAYVRSFRARVTALPPGGVVLDRTYFYPTGGGQPCDRGTLTLPEVGSVEVVDVSKSGPSVVHRIRSSAAVVRRLGVGSELEGTIDWERRHRHMRLHTSQHVLSARVFARTGRRTRRASFSGVRAQIDLDGPLPPEAVEPLAADMAEIAARDLPLSIRRVPRAEWDRNPFSARSGLVPLPPQVDPVRVVEIGDVDVCPCGGTHLRTTAEMGRVTLEPVTPTSDGGSRVVFTLDVAPTTAPVA